MRRYRIALSPRAGLEIDGIHNFIVQQSPQNAAEVVNQILSTIRSLETMPTRFRVERHVKRLGYVVHSVVVLSFVIFYRVMEEESVVRVLCVQRGAKRRPRSFD